MISPAELRAMQQLAQVSWRLEPTHVDVTVGELAYTWGVNNGTDYASEWRHRLWMDGDEALAWAWLFPPGSLEWQVHPGVPSSCWKTFAARRPTRSAACAHEVSGPTAARPGCA